MISLPPLRRLSLRTKMFWASVTLILTISAAIALLARGILVTSLTEELQGRGMAIAQSIAGDANSLLLDNKRDQLVSLIFDTAKIGERRNFVAYIFVVERSGELLAHTFLRPFPVELYGLLYGPKPQQENITSIGLNGGEVYDISAPIMEGITSLGSVHVGLSKQHLDNLVGALRTTFLGFLSLIIIVVLYLIIKLGNTVIRPLSALTIAAEGVSRGDLDTPMPFVVPLPGVSETKPDPKLCPAYRDTDLPCWHFDQRAMGTGEGKTCSMCQFYRKRDGDEIAAMADSFANMLWSIKLYRKRLKESEEKYRSLFDSNPNPVVIYALESMRVLDVNPRAVEVYGYTMKEFVGLDVRCLEAPERGRATGSGFASQGEACQLVNRVRHAKKDGGLFYVALNSCALTYRGQPAAMFSATDITDIVEKDALLIQAAKMKTLGEMSAGVAHELNQPLNAIKMGSEFLTLSATNVDSLVNAQQFAVVAAEISRQVDRAADIVSHLREFGRKSDLATELINVNRPVNDVFRILGSQLGLQGLAIELDLAENLPFVAVQSNRLEQVMFNLVANARDAVLENGNEDKRISISSYVEDADVVVSVRDTGKGIAEDAMGKIFEPFFTTKPAGQGMGLGLAISYGIVRDFGGRIDVSSKPGEGTTFFVRFPLVPQGASN